nr:muscle M-line assembly protein unc-89-like [Penaeus vannamei]
MDRRGRLGRQQDTELASLSRRRGRRRRRRRSGNSSSDEDLSFTRRCERYSFYHDHVYSRAGVAGGVRSAETARAVEDSWSEDEDSADDDAFSDAYMGDLSSSAEDDVVGEGARTSTTAGRRVKRKIKRRRRDSQLIHRRPDSQQSHSCSKLSQNEASGVHSQRTHAPLTGGGKTAAVPAAPPPTRVGVGRSQSPSELCFISQTPKGKAASCIFASPGQRQQRQLVSGRFTIRSSRKRLPQDGGGSGVPKKQLENPKQLELPSGIPEKQELPAEGPSKQILPSGTLQNPVLPTRTHSKYNPTQKPIFKVRCEGDEAFLRGSSASVKKELDVSNKGSQAKRKSCTAQDTTQHKTPMVVIQPDAMELLPQHVVDEWKDKHGYQARKAKTRCALVDVSKVRDNANIRLHGNNSKKTPSTSAIDLGHANQGTGGILTLIPRETSEQENVDIEALDETQLGCNAETNDMSDAAAVINIKSSQDKSNVSVINVGRKTSEEKARRDEAKEETRKHTTKKSAKGAAADESKHCTADSADTRGQQYKSKTPVKAKKKKCGPKATSELSGPSEQASISLKSVPQETVASISDSVPCSLKITEDPVTVKKGTKNTKHCTADNADTRGQQCRSKKPMKAKKKEYGPKATSEQASNSLQSVPQDTSACASDPVPCSLKVTEDPVDVKKEKTSPSVSMNNLEKIIGEVAAGSIPIDSRRLLRERWSTPVTEAATQVEKIIEKIATGSVQRRCSDDCKATGTVNRSVNVESVRLGSVKRNKKMVIPKQSNNDKKVSHCDEKKGEGKDHADQAGVKSNSEIPSLALEENKTKAVSANTLDFLPNLARELQHRLSSPSGGSQGEFNEASHIPRGRISPGPSKAQIGDSLPPGSEGCQGERPKQEGNMKDAPSIFTMSRGNSQTKSLNNTLFEKAFGPEKVCSVNVRKRRQCTDIAEMLIRRAKIEIEHCAISRMKTIKSEERIVTYRTSLVSRESSPESKMTVGLSQDVTGKRHAATRTTEKGLQEPDQCQGSGTKKDRKSVQNPTEKPRPPIPRPVSSSTSSKKNPAAVAPPPLSLSTSDKENFCGFPAPDDLDDFVQDKRLSLLSSYTKRKRTRNTEVSRKKKKEKQEDLSTSAQIKHENCRL